MQGRLKTCVMVFRRPFLLFKLGPLQNLEHLSLFIRKLLNINQDSRLRGNDGIF